MKAVFLLLIIPLLQVSASTYAQRITLQEKNASIELVFKKIKKQSGYSFLYEDGVLNEAKKVNLSISNESLETTLDRLFAEQPLTFSIKGKTIVVQPKEKSVVDKVIDFFSAIDVRGKVVNENGEPLQGATVKVKGSNLGVMTDKDGEFFLKGVSEDAILTIAYLGYKPLELRASASMGVIKMELATSELDEVTVSTGYWTTTKKLSTGNISKVTAKEIGNQPVVSPLLALQGRVAGLEVTISGNAVPGAAPKVRIRGNNSLRISSKLNGSYGTLGLTIEEDGNYPLYVIDGVPVSSAPVNTRAYLATDGFDPLSTINPENIESIEILKDGDGSAIYGSRGANGVILITTKNNIRKTEQTDLDLNVYRGIGKVSRKLDLLNTEQYLAMRREALQNDNVPVNNFSYDLKYWDPDSYTDWQDLLIGGTADITDVQAAVSSSNTYTSFRFGGGYHKETLVFPGNFGYYRVSGQSSLNHNSKNRKFKLTVLTNYGLDNNKLSDVGWLQSALTLPPNAPKLYNEDGSLNWEMHQVTSGIAEKTWDNPLSYLQMTNEVTNRNLVSNANLNYEILKGLLLQVSAGYTHLSSINYNKAPISAQAPEVASTGNRLFGYASLMDNRRISWIAEPKISYVKRIKAHSLDIIIGTSWQKNSGGIRLTEGTNYTSDALLNSLKGAGVISIGLDRLTEYKYTSIYGRIGYNWKQKYLINLTGRRDGSSRFGPNHRFGNFGSIGTAWIFSEESFIKKILSGLELGKLRASYGFTGSDLVADYKFYDLYDVFRGSYQGVIGFVPSGLYNPNFSWESTKKMEVGLELGFWNNKLGVEINWYRNRSSNQLVEYTLSNITGFPSVLANFGAVVQNQGWEGALNIAPIKDRQLNWNVSINISFPKSKLSRFENLEDSPYAVYYKLGAPLSVQPLYIYNGVNPQTGLYEFEDVNGDGVINALDKQLINPIETKYYGGLTNTLQYKRIELSFLFQYSNRPGFRYMPQLPGRVGYNQPVDVLERWFRPGDQTHIQRFATGTGENTSLKFSQLRESTFNNEDASYIRLQTLSLGYLIAPTLLKTIKLQSAKIFVQGQNLLTVTGYSGLDPETGNGLPPLRMVTAGLQIKL